MARMSSLQRESLNTVSANLQGTTLQASQQYGAREQALRSIQAVPELQAKYTMISGYLNSTRTSTIQAYYNIGEVLKDIKANPAKYGESAYSYFEAVFDKRVVNKARMFAETFTSQECKDLIDMEGEVNGHKNGNKLTYSHISFILSIRFSDKVTIRSWLQKALNAGWTGAEMHKKIKEAIGKRNGDHGRTPHMPETKLELIDQIQKSMDTMLNKYKKVWEKEEDPLLLTLTVDYNGVNDELLDTERNLYATLQAAEDAVSVIKKTVGNAITCHEAYINKQADVKAPSTEDGVTLDIMDNDEVFTYDAGAAYEATT